MFVLKLLLWITAIFSTIQYINNILVDIEDAGNASRIFTTPEEKKGSYDRSLKLAKYRLILSAIMAVSWALIIML